MTEKTKLAAALAGLASTSAGLESRADAVLAIVRRTRIGTEKEFSIAVRDAYAANGWNAGAGKPVEGVSLKPVPGTVKQYVSQIRAAYRFKIDVLHCRSFYELRKGLRKARARKSASLADPVMHNLKIAGKAELTGAPLHDIVVIYTTLSETRRKQLAAAVNRLVREYRELAVVGAEDRLAA